ncbi:VOC family protein [Sphingomonas sp. CFBP 13706]|uniref:VOC family protein n=1 Tax=Sphingomonas sp. CFBP 13706 TaxID=2775314 RepID=UPI00177B8507|nr:VOC family protein [Sphingomonas sp. CFBP 13706]MBD8737230.1 VOC family protein [Sphingomonas sp. CFBP 13706]
MGQDFPITGLRSVDFDVPDLEAATAFYTDIWGLSLAVRSEGTVWLRGTGSDPYLLALHAASTPAIRSMTFRVAPKADPEALAAVMVAHGAELTTPRTTTDEPGGGTIVAVRDAQGRTIRLVQHDTRVAPLPADADRPERIAHVNFNSDDVDRDAAFYTNALGFTLTDRSKMMAFVRTNSDHHSIVIADAPVNTLNHVAFQMPSWEGVMRASGRMVDHRFAIGWGPGRHGPGNNVFAYFVDPFGFVVEYTADVLQVDEHYRVGRPQDWTWPPGRTDQWGIAPPKTLECKAAQLAIPFA